MEWTSKCDGWWRIPLTISKLLNHSSDIGQRARLISINHFGVCIFGRLQITGNCKKKKRYSVFVSRTAPSQSIISHRWCDRQREGRTDWLLNPSIYSETATLIGSSSHRKSRHVSNAQTECDRLDDVFNLLRHECHSPDHSFLVPIQFITSQHFDEFHSIMSSPCDKYINRWNVIFDTIVCRTNSFSSACFSATEFFWVFCKLFLHSFNSVGYWANESDGNL